MLCSGGDLTRVGLRMLCEEPKEIIAADEGYSSRMLHSPRVDVMFHRRRFDREGQHSLFEFAIRYCEPAMLPLMFSPGIHQKCLEIDIGLFCVIEDSPSRGTVAAANSLIQMESHTLPEVARHNIVFPLVRFPRYSGVCQSGVPSNFAFNRTSKRLSLVAKK